MRLIFFFSLQDEAKGKGMQPSSASVLLSTLAENLALDQCAKPTQVH